MANSPQASKIDLDDPLADDELDLVRCASHPHMQCLAMRQCTDSGLSAYDAAIGPALRSWSRLREDNGVVQMPSLTPDNL